MAVAAGKRPGVVVALGVIYLVLGLLVFLLSALTLLLVVVSLPPAVGPMLLAVAFAALGGLGIVAAVSLLELHAWARTALEVLTWLALACLSPPLVLELVASGKLVSQGARFGPVFLSVVFVFLALVLSFCGVLIWLLRSPAVREAMQPRASG